MCLSLSSAVPGSLFDFQVPVPRGPLPIVLPASSSSDVPDKAEPVMGYVMRVSRVDLTWETLVDRRMVAAIRKWSAVILRAPLVFDLGRRCSTAAPLGEQLPSMLKHVFAGRSPGTLHNRAGPVLRYLAWCDSNETMPLPFSEEAVYVFCTYLESTCAPTFMKSLVTSISFCHHVLGAAGALDCLRSNRLLGVARLTYLRKRKKLQRPPFTVEMVTRLELFICDSGNWPFETTVWSMFGVVSGGAPRYEVSSEGKRHVGRRRRECSSGENLQGVMLSMNEHMQM